MQNPVPGIQSFIFGDGKNAPTYESLQRRRKIADLLAAQATGGTPRNVGEGLNAVGKAIAGVVLDRKLGPKEDEERQRMADIVAGRVGGAGSGFTGAGYSGDASTMPDYGSAIASVESGGNYGAQGPVTKTGDRAYGKYQVMGRNIPDWSQAALGQSLTPEQFLSDPKAQDAVFQKQFGGYVDQYGPEGAASMWFSGDPTPDGDKDQLGTSDHDYVSKVSAALGMPASSFQPQPVDNERIGQLSEVLSNPYASEGQKAVAEALIQKMIAGSDPSAALGMLGQASSIYERSQPEEMTPYQQEMLKLEREQMAVGNRGQYGLNPIEGTGPDGQPLYVQPGSDGSVNTMQFPEGFQPTPGVQKVDTGTGTALINTKTGEMIGFTPKDVAGAAAQKEVGAAAGTAAAGLGDREIAVNAAVEQIDRIAGNEALPGITGMLQGQIPPFTQAGTNLNEDIKGLTSKTFANAIDALRGLGAMTEAEGRAATESLANLSRARDENSFKSELSRLRATLLEKLEVARQKAGQVAGQPAPPAAPAQAAPPAQVPPTGGIPKSAADAGIDPNLWQFMSPEERALWN